MKIIKTILRLVIIGTAVLSLSAFGKHHPKLRKVNPKKLKIISEQAAREYMVSTLPYMKNKPSSVAPAAGTALPVFSYTIRAAQDNNSYTGSIVGGNALAGAQGTTTVPALVIPVVLNITQGGVTFTFDPTAPDDGCLGSGNTAFKLLQASPIFQNSSIAMNGFNAGTTQYIDAFQRAEFSSKIDPTYHVLLNPTASDPLVVTLDAGTSGSATAEVVALMGTQCGTNASNVNVKAQLAIVNIDSIDAQLQDYMSSHNVNPAQFPFFLMYNSALASGAPNAGNNCCILGYHNALSNNQTYGIADFEGRFNTAFKSTGDISTAVHEVGEWANDPFGNNPTPAWGGLGQVSACQSNLEVGDPLSGVLAPAISLNGFTYHPQELAFFSWFYGGTIGAGGKASSNGTFGGPAKLCPPGGTN